MAGGRTPYEAEHDRAIAAEMKLHAIRLLHAPGTYGNAERGDIPCCMVCMHSERWPCRTRQEIDRQWPMTQASKTTMQDKSDQGTARNG